MLRRALARAPLRAVAFAAAGTTAATYSLAEAASPTSLDAAASQPIVAKLSSMRNRALCFSSEEKVDLVVVSPTFFPSVNDTRCQLGLEACRRAKSNGIQLLLVDASPPEVAEALREAGATVRPQTRKGRKGAALRECIELAREMLPADGIICFQELEKVEMVALQPAVAAHLRRTGADICVPGREDTLFRATYPIEQYHSERFANGYLDALGERSAGAAPLPQIDWTFGPVGLRASAAEHWLRVDGDLWDAQIVPFVHAARWHGARVEALEVAYAHPPKMKAEEEGVPLWSEKRLLQLNFLFKHVGGALKEEQAPAGA